MLPPFWLPASPPELAPPADRLASSAAQFFLPLILAPQPADRHACDGHIDAVHGAVFYGTAVSARQRADRLARPGHCLLRVHLVDNVFQPVIAVRSKDAEKSQIITVCSKNDVLDKMEAAVVGT